MEVVQLDGSRRVQRPDGVYGERSVSVPHGRRWTTRVEGVRDSPGLTSPQRLSLTFL